MTRHLASLATIAALLLAAALPLAPAQAQDGPLRIEITQGVQRPMPIALRFEAEAAAQDLRDQITEVIAADLATTGLFEIAQDGDTPETHFERSIDYIAWKATQVEAVVTGRVVEAEDGVSVAFRLFDVFAGQPLGDGIQFDAPAEGWRRAAHKVADQIYARITGESPYFDSRIAFVGESGPATERVTRIGVMDQDGAGVQWLTEPGELVLSPRFSPDGRTILYTDFATGTAQIMSLDLGRVESMPLTRDPRAMSFAPRYSPDGKWIAFSRETAGNTDIWIMQVDNPSFAKPLTQGPSIDTAPSWSPDGQHLVFESDRSGSSQLYVMRADGSNPTRISFGGEGAYGEPAWSPRGDRIAFTRQTGTGSIIGIMRPDGSDEQILSGPVAPGLQAPDPLSEALEEATDLPPEAVQQEIPASEDAAAEDSAWRDAGPSWAPNGRVLIFTRFTDGEDSGRLHSVDITGRNMRPVALNIAASDPAWGPLLP